MESRNKGHWKRGPLTVTYDAYPDSVHIELFLYQAKIGYANLSLRFPSAGKSGKSDKAKLTIRVTANFEKKSLHCLGDLDVYAIETHDWKREEIDEVIAQW